LHLAVLSGNGKNVHKLLSKGASQNIKDADNKYAIDNAIDNGYESIEKLIVITLINLLLI